LSSGFLFVFLCGGLLMLCFVVVMRGVICLILLSSCACWLIVRSMFLRDLCVGCVWLLSLVLIFLLFLMMFRIMCCLWRVFMLSVMVLIS